MTRVLITGVRGKTGWPLAELLAARPGVDVIGGSGQPAAVTIDGVRSTLFSWDDPGSWVTVSDGVDAVYVVRPDREDAPELVAGLLAAIPAESRVVLLSERDVDSFAPGGWAPRVEQVVRENGRPWTVLRPSWFMQVLGDPRFYRNDVAEKAELPFAGGGASVAWIDARDIAAVAERALLGDGHDGRTYELSGPEALTLSRTVEVLSAALGRPIAHAEITIAAASAGLPEFDRQLLVTTLERVHDGVFAVVTDTVEQVTGRPARDLATYVADHRSLFDSP